MLKSARLAAALAPFSSSPVEASLQRLRWLKRSPSLGRWMPSPPCRSLHMYLTARSKTVLGMQEVVKWSLYQLPELEDSEHRINIVKLVHTEHGSQVKEMVAQDITLKHAYENYVEPGKMMLLADTVTKPDVPMRLALLKEKGTVNHFRDYVILDAYSTGKRATIKSPAESKHSREITHMQSLREFRFLLSSQLQHNAQQMDQAYQFLELGCPVEFSMRTRQITERKFDELRLHEDDTFGYVYRHFPHLRPDFVLKSMPLGTRYVIKPFSNGRHVQFVLGCGPSKLDNLGSTDLTKRLLRVQEMVQRSVEESKRAKWKRAKDGAKADGKGEGEDAANMLQKLAMNGVKAGRKGESRKSKQEHVIPPEIVEANRKRQKDAAEKRRQWLEEKHERDAARERNKEREYRGSTVEYGVSWRRRI